MILIFGGMEILIIQFSRTPFHFFIPMIKANADRNYADDYREQPLGIPTDTSGAQPLEETKK
jgi:hypothetical protein